MEVTLKDKGPRPPRSRPVRNYTADEKGDAGNNDIAATADADDEQSDHVEANRKPPQWTTQAGEFPENLCVRVQKTKTPNQHPKNASGEKLK